MISFLLKPTELQQRLLPENKSGSQGDWSDDQDPTASPPPPPPNVAGVDATDLEAMVRAEVKAALKEHRTAIHQTVRKATKETVDAEKLYWTESIPAYFLKVDSDPVYCRSWQRRNCYDFHRFNNTSIIPSRLGKCVKEAQGYINLFLYKKMSWFFCV